jgi:Domain of unknown function (DUF4259)/SMI1 / KNR4 family (SUKH-1)
MLIKFREISFNTSRYFPISIEELLEIESQLGFSFPEDYRAFITILGAGETSICIRAFSPKDAKNRGDETRERLVDYWFWTDSSDILTKERALECLPFFDSYVGDDIIFHPDEPDRWFILPHEATHIYVVSSFRELVSHYCPYDDDDDNEQNIDSIFKFEGWSVTADVNISGYSSFENFDANELLSECEELSDLSLISDVIDIVIEDSESKLEIPECYRAIAAAEMIAALIGKGSSLIPDEVATWAKEKPQPTPILVEQARQAIDRILTDSELKEAWEEYAEYYPKWVDLLKDIQYRLS